MVAIAVVVFVGALWLAWKDVAYPLALAGIPTLITAVVGTNPLPKGGSTFLVGAWIALAVLISAMRGEQSLAAGALWSAPVALAVLLLGLMVFRLSASADEAYGSMKVQLYIADNLLFLVGAVCVGRQALEPEVVLRADVGDPVRGRGSAARQAAGRWRPAAVQQPVAISAQQGAINLGHTAQRRFDRDWRNPDRQPRVGVNGGGRGAPRAAGVAARRRLARARACVRRGADRAGRAGRRRRPGAPPRSWRSSRRCFSRPRSSSRWSCPGRRSGGPYRRSSAARAGCPATAARACGRSRSRRSAATRCSGSAPAGSPRSTPRRSPTTCCSRWRPRWESSACSRSLR